MSEGEQGSAAEAAMERLDKALGRLESSIRSLNGRMRSLDKLEAESQRLASDRARLASELDRSMAREKRLDDSTADVSRRLVEAMETVKSVLTSEDRG